jgi:hypothetical protein
MLNRACTALTLNTVTPLLACPAPSAPTLPLAQHGHPQSQGHELQKQPLVQLSAPACMCQGYPCMAIHAGHSPQVRKQVTLANSLK